MNSEPATVAYTDGLRRRMERAGVDLDTLDALSPGRIRETPLLAVARRFTETKAEAARFLVLSGPRGVGKSVAAGWALRELMSRFEGRSLPSGSVHPPDGSWALAGTLARVSGYDRADRDWFEELCRTRVLVLDDFGAEHFGPFGKAMLEELLMRRYGKRLRTIITTNLDLEGVRARLDVRLYDRVRVSCVVGVEKGESLRAKARTGTI